MPPVYYRPHGHYLRGPLRSSLLRLLLIVGLTLLLSAWLLGYLPKPPRRHLTIEKAQHWRARYDTPAMRNRRYYRAYPR